MSVNWRRWGELIALAGALPTAAGAQAHEHSGAQSSVSVGASAVGLLTRAAPAARDRTRTEVYLAQPMAMAHARLWGGTVEGRAMVNFEGLTLDRGELLPGIWGEGYIDRRHPHTFAHEAMLTLTLSRQGPRALSLGIGKGFVPFGSDDPMSRPLVKYPLNHHLAQILERAQIVVAGRVGALLLEGAAFNGDEPTGPSDAPELSRVGDSWATRATVLHRDLEVSASLAYVESPEDAGGHGLDQRKQHAGLRYSPRGTNKGVRYALIEWGRTREYDQGRLAWEFDTILGEIAADFGAVRTALRLERTTRPDEERTENVFRSIRPILDFHILGRSRWDVVSLLLAAPVSRARLVAAEPFVEVNYSRVRETIAPTTFVPAEFYGRSRIATMNIGVRLGVGALMHRVGDYGAARREP